jgi:1-acyl-sn-glycerol-3-phosphate acyltransferase
MNKLKVLLLNLWFLPMYMLVNLTVIPLFTLAMVVWRPFTTHRGALRLLRRLISMYGRCVVAVPWPWARVELSGEGWHDHHREPCLFICNHRSSSDPYLMSFLPCELVQVINKWPFKLPILGIVARIAGYLSVREMPPEEFYEHATRLLRDGCSLVAFPEGTRSGGKAMGAFHGTVFRMAQLAGVPIVPLCISGNEQSPPRGSVAIRPAVVQLRMLPPVRPEDYREMTPFHLKTHVRKLIAAELERMEGPAQ